MRKNTLIAIMISGSFAISAMTGCSSGSGKSIFETTAVEDENGVESTLKASGITVSGKLGSAVSVKKEEINSANDTYAKVKELVKEDNFVTMDLEYINLYDEAGEKTKQSGSADFILKMSSDIYNAGGDTYKLYYFSSAANTVTAIDFTLDEDNISFTSDNIGYFVVAKINNTGVEITEPVTEKTTKRGEDGNTDNTPAQGTTQAQTAAPTQGSSQTVTQAPTQKQTDSGSNDSSTVEGPTVYRGSDTKETTASVYVAPTEAEVATPAGSGNMETPSISAMGDNPKSNEGNTRIMHVSVTNKGNYVMRILPSNCTYTDNKNTSNSRTLLLTDSGYNKLSYQDIGAGQTVDVYFTVVGDQTWYKTTGIISFEFSYDGVTYVCSESYSGGYSVSKK